MHEALRAFNTQGRLDGKRILIVCDNQAVHYILESGSRHDDLQALALQIVEFCIDHGAVLSSMWVPRTFEQRTDELSKVRDYDDWMVHPAIFRSLDGWIAGGYRHTADRFATDKNHLVRRFYSAWWCPGTAGVDSLRQTDWRDFVNWCNPPFRLIGELLLFLQAERAAATVVVPGWTTQPWWLLLCPDGVHFADCVVQWTELETSRSTFLPGLGRANEEGVGLPDFRVFVVRVSFDEREPAGPGARCTRYGCAACDWGRSLRWGVPFPRRQTRQ